MRKPAPEKGAPKKSTPTFERKRQDNIATDSDSAFKREAGTHKKTFRRLVL